MGSRRRVALAVAIFALAACKREVDVHDPELHPRDEAPAPKPVDHLAPGEILEGSEKAFALTLPRGAKIVGAFSDVVYATAPGALGPMLDYVRARVRDGTITKGQYTATFEHVKIPGLPGREFRVRIAEMLGQPTSLEVRDTTPVPVPQLPDEESRWRQVGLTKDGRVLDPRHVE